MLFIFVNKFSIIFLVSINFSKSQLIWVKIKLTENDNKLSNYD